MQAEAGFREEIEQSRECWDTMLVYADWLSEQDRLQEEFLWRWVARWKRTPHQRTYYTHQGDRMSKVPARFGWGWYPDSVAPYRIDPHPPHEARLPRLVFSAIPGHSHDHCYRGSFWEAIKSLEQALDRLRAVLVIQ